LNAAKEKLEIVNFRGGSAYVCPATSESRKARRVNSARAILRIRRQAGKDGVQSDDAEKTFGDSAGL